MPKDWRGTEINVGDVVVYGSGVGQSIQMNEAEVVGWGEEKRKEYGSKQDVTKIKLRIIRRSYMSGTKPVVSVGADRLTVVSELPPSDLETQQDQVDAADAAKAVRSANMASHTVPPRTVKKPKKVAMIFGRYSEEYQQWERDIRAYEADDPYFKACLVCGKKGYDKYHVKCEGAES